MENLEFYNRNSLIAFPFKENSSRLSTNGVMAIPNSTLVDFVLVVPESKASNTIYLNRLSLFGQLLTLEFTDDAGKSVTLIAINISIHVPYTGYYLNGIGEYTSAQGKIVLGNLTDIVAFPNGVYEFDQTATTLEITCLRPDIRGLNGLILVNGDVESDAIYGDIQFVAGSNFKLEEPVPGTIRLSAISGEGLVVVDPCADAIALPPPIRTINGISPDVNGNFGIQGSACMTFTGSTGLLSITDNCSQACCSCTELEWITDRLTLLVSQNADLQNQFSQMTNQITDFQTNVLANTN